RLPRRGAGGTVPATMTRSIRVLVADDESRLRELLVRELGRKGHEVEGVSDGEAALTRLRDAAYDIVILDMKMPRKEGIEVLRELSAFPEHPQVIVMTGFQEVATAVEAMKLGAYDYLTKPTKIEELDVVIRKAAEKGQLLRDNHALRAHAAGAAPFSGILTKSPRMHDVMRVVERVAPTDSAVLVLGESGTGKELVARAIHERSPRAARRRGQRRVRRQASERGGAGRARGLPVAGQRARAAARHRARGDPVAWRGNPAERPAPRGARRGGAVAGGRGGRRESRDDRAPAHRRHAATGQRPPRQGRRLARDRPQDALPQNHRLPDPARGIQLDSGAAARRRRACIRRVGRDAPPGVVPRARAWEIARFMRLGCGTCLARFAVAP